jgi:hypothetical protein
VNSFSISEKTEFNIFFEKSMRSDEIWKALRVIEEFAKKPDR